MESSNNSRICSRPGCGKSANMSCPTCIKLGIPPSLFCDQNCFKSYWTIHKSIHKLIENKSNDIIDKSSLPREFIGYKFTGSLRPYQKSSTRLIPGHIAKPDYANHLQGIPISEQLDRRSNSTIKEYNSNEIEKLRIVCRLGREILDIAGNALRVGITTDEIDEIVHNETIARDAYPSPLNYHCFPKSVCTSVNEVICHGIPDYRPLLDGDIVNIDISVYKDGYHADLNETFFIGNVDKDSIRLVECAYKCLSAAVDICKPGTMYRDAGNAIDKVAREFGCSVVTTYCGHGVGELFHTAPTIPHYAYNKAKGSMKPGHVFTIEPMINLGKSNDKLWPDNWTAVTVDGTRSSQFEHVILITETGCELLTQRLNEPIDKMIWNQNAFQR